MCDVRAQASVRQARLVGGDAEEAKRDRESARLECVLLSQQWEQERKELTHAIEALRASLQVPCVTHMLSCVTRHSANGCVCAVVQASEAAHNDDVTALRGRLAETAAALSRSVSREEDRLEELSRVRIEAGVAKQRADSADKRIRALQEQLQSQLRRSYPTPAVL